MEEVPLQVVVVVGCLRPRCKVRSMQDGLAVELGNHMVIQFSLGLCLPVIEPLWWSSPAQGEYNHPVVIWETRLLPNWWGWRTVGRSPLAFQLAFPDMSIWDFESSCWSEGAPGLLALLQLRSFVRSFVEVSHRKPSSSLLRRLIADHELVPVLQ